MATVRPRPQVMRLSDAAASRIKDIMENAERPIAGIRVGVKNGGLRRNVLHHGIRRVRRPSR